MKSSGFPVFGGRISAQQQTADLNFCFHGVLILGQNLSHSNKHQLTGQKQLALVLKHNNVPAMRDKRLLSLNGKVGQHLECTKEAVPDAAPLPLLLLSFLLRPPSHGRRPKCFAFNCLSRCHEAALVCLTAHKFWRSNDIVEQRSGLTKNVLMGHQARPGARALTCLSMQNLWIPVFQDRTCYSHREGKAGVTTPPQV